jgi:Icc-related predicted phosphoesterase
VNGPELLKYRNYKNIEKNQLQKSVQKYNKLITKYSKLFNKSKNPTILLSHNVPFNTSLDTIQNKSSPMNGKHYGSNLARDLIIKHKPILCVAGHMHEHYGTCKIGQTVVLNAGFGGKNNTLIIFKKGKITSVKFFGKKK